MAVILALLVTALIFQYLAVIFHIDYNLIESKRELLLISTPILGGLAMIFYYFANIWRDLPW